VWWYVPKRMDPYGGPSTFSHQHATRKTHHTQSPFHQARSIPSNTKKTIFDAWNGYHSVPLYTSTIVTSDHHVHYTYGYCTAPQGYITSGDADTMRSSPTSTRRLSASMTRCFGHPTYRKHTYRQWNGWMSCGTNGVTLNPENSSWQRGICGIRDHPNDGETQQEYTRAIQDFPTPKNLQMSDHGLDW
jgi:hypothetical protein